MTREKWWKSIVLLFVITAGTCCYYLSCYYTQERQRSSKQQTTVVPTILAFEDDGHDLPDCKPLSLEKAQEWREVNHLAPSEKNNSTEVQERYGIDLFLSSSKNNNKAEIQGRHRVDLFLSSAKNNDNAERTIKHVMQTISPLSKNDYSSKAQEINRRSSSLEKGDLTDISRWQMVDAKSEWYIYSAYVDYRSSVPLVRIIAMSKGDWREPLYCRWWLDAKKVSLKPVNVQKQELWVRTWDNSVANQNKYYHPFLLSCPVVSGEFPKAVSVVRERCGQPKHRIRLQTTPSLSSDFVVCLKPLNFDKDMSLSMLEWLELQYILGADKVQAYVYNLHPNMWKVLRHYEALGRLSWQNYTLPADSHQKLKLWQKRRYEMAVYNDCFYKHINSHRYVVNLDIDEAIVPVAMDTWPEMLATWISDQHHSTSASLSARNVYFFESFGEEDIDYDIPPHMYMLRHVIRSANFTPPGFAQKSFFSTAFTEVVSNHYALRSFRPDVRLMSGMDMSSVRLHHYRKGCPALMERDCEQNYMKFRKRDTLIWKYKKRLIQNVLQSMQELGFLTRRQSRVNE